MRKTIKKRLIALIILLTTQILPCLYSSPRAFRVLKSRIYFGKILVEFNEAVNPAIINGNTVYILGNSGILKRRIKIINSGRTLKIKLTGRDFYKILRPIVLVISPEVKSVSSKPLSDGYIKGFNISIKSKNKMVFFVKVSSHPNIEIGNYWFKRMRWNEIRSEKDNTNTSLNKIKGPLSPSDQRDFEKLKNKILKDRVLRNNRNTFIYGNKFNAHFGSFLFPRIKVSGVSNNLLTNKNVNIKISVTGKNIYFYHSFVNFKHFKNRKRTGLEGRHWLFVIASTYFHTGSYKFYRFKIDKTPPSFINLPPSSDISTDKNTITISGKISEPSILKINNKKMPLNNLSFSKIYALKKGENIFNLIAIDKAGNKTEKTLKITYVFDQKPPEVEIISPEENSYLKTEEITIRGTVRDESGVKYLRINGKDAVINGENWSISGIVLSEGGNTLSLETEDNTGNKGTHSFKLYLDTIQPVINIEAPEDNYYTKDKKVLTKGEITDSSPVELKINSGAVNLTDNRFSIQLNLNLGENFIKYTAKDRAGNISEKTLRITVDSIPPIIIIKSHEDGDIVGENSITVSGEYIDDNLAEIKIGSATGDIIGKNFYIKNLFLQAGENNLIIKAKDRAGNSSERTLKIIYDNTKPEITVESPVSGSFLKSRTILVKGIVTDDNIKEVRVNGVITELKNNGFSVFLQLSEGVNKVTVSATDKGGNYSEKEVPFVIDTTAPVIMIDKPADNSIVSTSKINIKGRISDPNILSVKINGKNATLTGSEFSLNSFSLKEGDNTIKIEATDRAGNSSEKTIKITLDNIPPEIISIIPEPGTKDFSPMTPIEITLSEPVKDETVNTTTISIKEESGNRVGGRYEVSGNKIRFTPESGYPDGKKIIVNITTGIKDYAGNPLKSGKTFTFYTTDKTPPEPPVLNNIPKKVYSEEITISGTSEAGAKIKVEGDYFGETIVKTDRTFAITIRLKKNKLNQIFITATDKAGNISEPVKLNIYQDNGSFIVTDSSYDNNKITMEFSRPVEQSTLNSDTLIITAKLGKITGTINFSGENTAIFEPGIDLSGKTFILRITKGVRDREGNTLRTEYTKTFNQSEDSAAIEGQVFDNVSGLPLEGAIVKLIKIDGKVPESPIPQTVTSREGKYVLFVPGGKCTIKISKEGYIPSYRVILTASGFGAKVFDARLTPANTDNYEIKSESGIIKGAGWTIIYPSGAVNGAKKLSVTRVEGQGLIGAPPYGWSPVFILDFMTEDNTSLLKQVDLKIDNTLKLSDPSDIILAIWDESDYVWKAYSAVSVSEKQISGKIKTSAQYCFFIRDKEPIKPDIPPIGSPLPSASINSLPAQTTGSIGFAPPEIVPGETSEVSVKLTTQTPITSGTPIQAKISEKYESLYGNEIKYIPYTIDLRAYNYGTSVSSFKFNLSVNQEIKITDIRFGEIETEVIKKKEGNAGMIIGTEGGTITGEDGLELKIEKDSVKNPIPVVLKKREENELPLSVPEGFEYIKGVYISFGGYGLLKRAVLSLPLPSGINTEDQIILVRIKKLDMKIAWEIVERCKIESDKIISDLTAPLPFKGITEGGEYLIIRATSPVAYIKGIITQEGNPLSGAIISVEGSEIIVVSDNSGNYAQVSFIGEKKVKAENRFTGDEAEATINITGKNSINQLDLSIIEKGPEVVSVTPSDGAKDVPLGSRIMVIFSKEIDASTFNKDNFRVIGGIELLEGTYKLSSDGKSGTFTPLSPLPSGQTINITITSGIKDINSNPLVSTFSSSFRTEDRTPPETDLSKIKVLIPENGKTKIIGEAGSVEPGTTVVIINMRTGVAITVQGFSDGSFVAEIEATMDDNLSIKVIDGAGNETKLNLDKYVSVDGKTVVFSTKGGEYITPEGVGIKVEEGTFEGAVPIRLEKITGQSLLLQNPEKFTRLDAIRVDFGVMARKPVKLSVVAPQGISAGSKMFIAREVEIFGEKKLMIVDSVSYKEGRIETNSPPWPGVREGGIFSFLLSKIQSMVYLSGTLPTLTSVFMAGDLVYYPDMINSNSNKYIIPVEKNTDIKIQVKDIITGETLFEGEENSGSEGEGTHEININYGFDREPPMLDRIGESEGSKIKVVYKRIIFYL